MRAIRYYRAIHRLCDLADAYTRPGHASHLRLFGVANVNVHLCGRVLLDGAAIGALLISG